MIFGRDMYVELDESNTNLSILFFIIFSIVFYFVILNVYAAIVMRTYDNLRQKKQLHTEAMADISAKKAIEKGNKIRNIIFCTDKPTRADESDSSSSSDREYDIDDKEQEYAEMLRRYRIRKIHRI